MNSETQALITFEVETSRVLEILSKEIYDSPHALLRENLQNAYDAVLMRCKLQDLDLRVQEITIKVEPQRLVVADCGIGMNEDVLRANFWTAGSSGKRTELAERSGVIGSFGIGAMANFGVCTRLRVETRYVDSDVTLISTAEREKLSISKPCIDFERVKDDRSAGTKIIAELCTDQQLDEASVRSYLEPYVRFLPLRVLLNGEVISQQSFQSVLEEMSKPHENLGINEVSHGMYRGSLGVSANAAGNVVAHLGNIQLDGTEIRGDMYLIQQGGQLMGLRNFFGLAPVPVSGHYQFGGFANLSLLNPTAGREALSRESIQHVSNLVSMVEAEVSRSVADNTLADRNSAFQQYILSHGKTEWAGNVSVEVLPLDKPIALGAVRDECHGKKLHHYAGRDQSILRMFASEDSRLVHISQSNPRRKLQLRYVTNVLSIPEVPDRATVLEEYSQLQLTMGEAALLIRVALVVADDYLLPNVKLSFARISHGVQFLVSKEPDDLQIKVARDAATVRQVVECYETAREVFDGFVKDFVRSYIYPQISQYVPSSTREGTEALQKLLQRNRELYRYEESELGDLEPLFGDYLSGEVTLGEVLRTARSKARPQTQRVRQDQIGEVEQELPGVVDSPGAAELAEVEGQQYDPAPPIMREHVSSKMKILTVAEKHAELNQFQLFLGLSDRLFRREGSFFSVPHTTKLIWASHRVVYIFTEASGRLTLYYDIELREPLEDEEAHGGMFPTTTLFTKDRIYVPIPPNLEPAFRIVDGFKEFYVRFDVITND